MKFREAKGVLNKVNQIIENNGYLVIAANHIENKNMTDPDYTEKVGSRSYKYFQGNETVHLFDEFGCMSVVEILCELVIKQIGDIEKYANPDGKGAKEIFYIGQKISVKS